MASGKMDVDEQVYIKEEDEDSDNDDLTDKIVTDVNDGAQPLHNCYMHYKADKRRCKGEFGKHRKTCFYTTMAIDADPSECVIIDNVLVDTGAAGYFIHRKVVSKLGLKASTLPEPEIFQACGGHTIIHTEYVKVKLWLAGVAVEVLAFVDDSKDSDLFLLGAPMLDDFLLDMHTRRKGSGKQSAKERERVFTVAEDVTGCRKKQYLLPQDVKGRSKMRKVPHNSAWADRAKKGMTVGEQKVRKKQKLTILRELGSLSLEKLIEVNEHAQTIKEEY